jgi:hypothetical protein
MSGGSTSPGDGGSPPWPARWSPIRATSYVLGSFLVVFTGFAIVLQVQSGEPPNADGTVIDVFNANLMWMVSILAIVMASMRLTRRSAFLIWVAASAAAAGLAIDEVFEYHERTLQVIGEDDWSKVLMWVGALGALAVLWRIEDLSRGAKVALLAGIGLQTAYLVSDLGDGDLFLLPIADPTLRWVEELLELLAMQAYLVGIVLVVLAAIEGIRSGPLGQRAGGEAEEDPAVGTV